ncbi:MAG: nucleotidyltransferase family protein [Thermodesulfobacteriota bacterium]|jgi:CTP:molybdopterin cytidylyltransferase MocA|nr:nucleotidyltransferase family protein [Thermodesulfobacteriota bacterium]
MGRCKQLLPLNESPALRLVINALTEGHVERIAVVLGPQGMEVSSAAEAPNTILVTNPDPAGDMSSSVLAGLSALDSGYAAILIALADMPLIRPATIRALIRFYRQAPCAVLIPTHFGRGGHPPLFAQSVLRGLRPGETLRDLRNRHKADTRRLPVDDPGILLDMDTPEDYTYLHTLLQKQREH